MRCHHQIAVLCFIPREVIYFYFFVSCHSFVAERGQGFYHHPSWFSGSRSPGCDTSAWTSFLWWKSCTACSRGRLFLSLFLWCFAPSICCVCYAELRLARVVLVTIHPLLCRSLGICLLACLFSWGVANACTASFLAYVIFLMMFCFWPYVLSKLVSMACVSFKLPFYSVCGFRSRFHGRYYSSFNFHSVLLASCFHSRSLSSCFSDMCRLKVSFLGVCHPQVVFMECVTFQLAVFGMCRFHSSFMVSFVFFSLFSFKELVSHASCLYGVCHLQVVFRASAAFMLVHF